MFEHYFTIQSASFMSLGVSGWKKMEIAFLQELEINFSFDLSEVKFLWDFCFYTGVLKAFFSSGTNLGRLKTYQLIKFVLSIC